MKLHWKHFLALLLTTALLVSGAPAGAEGSGQPPSEGGADGYIFALRGDAPMFLQMEELPGIQEISAAHGVYRADSLEDLAAFASEEYIEYVTPDYLIELFDAVPNDPAISSGDAWNLDMIDMTYAWENQITGKGVRVGIVDSGVNRAHVDFAASHIEPGTFYPHAGSDNPDPVPGSPDPDDPNGSTRPTNAHGTFVSGLISATTNNGIGTAGVAPGVEVIPLTAFASNTTYLSAICKAIYGGVDDYNCDVLNMSLGIYPDDILPSGNHPDLTPLDKAIAHAVEEGVILVASVGNRGNTQLSYPAAYPEVIGVGSVKGNGLYSSSSQHNESVLLTAPGDNVYSLAYNSNTGYSTGSGTSYAAPQVAAAVALALEIAPGLTSEQIMELFASTAVDKGAAGWDDYYGYGVLNISAFLEKVTAWAELEEVPGGVSLTAHGARFDPEQELTLLAAAYDASGRMVDAVSTVTTAEVDGTLRAPGLSLDTTADAVEVKVFYWDAATSAPLRDSVTIPLE